MWLHSGHVFIDEKCDLSTTIHSLCFIRDGLKFCLGPSLIFLGNLPRPVPYSSLIFLENFDRLSLNISFWHEVCVKQITRGCQFLTWSMNETKWRKQSAVNQTLSPNFSNFCLESLTSCLLNFSESLGLVSYFFRKFAYRLL